jgi:hypothetical protein
MQKALAWFQTAGEIVRRRDHRRNMTYIGANDSETRRLQKEFGAASAEVTVVSTDTVKQDRELAAKLFLPGVIHSNNWERFILPDVQEVKYFLDCGSPILHLKSKSGLEDALVK